MAVSNLPPTCLQPASNLPPTCLQPRLLPACLRPCRFHPAVPCPTTIKRTHNELDDHATSNRTNRSPHPLNLSLCPSLLPSSVQRACARMSTAPHEHNTTIRAEAPCNRCQTKCPRFQRHSATGFSSQFAQNAAKPLKLAIALDGSDMVPPGSIHIVDQRLL